MSTFDADTRRRLAQRRLAELLESFRKQEISQLQIAARANLPPQYLSDIKTGRRPMTELVARRLSDAFDVNMQWLMGTSGSKDKLRIAEQALAGNDRVWLPLFPYPIDGEPRTHPHWDGTSVEVAGPAIAKLLTATKPYVLRYGNDDIDGRIQKGDLLLISQSTVQNAELHVVKNRNKLFLARTTAEGIWKRAANGHELPNTCPINGHVVAVVWSPMAPYR